MMKIRVCHTIAGLLLLAAVLIFDAFGIEDAFAAGSGDAHGTAEGGHAVGHDAGHAESSGGLPQLDTSTYPSQLFWLAITFGILYFIFSKRSLPQISNVLENRQAHIQSDLETAEKLRADAEKAQEAYETSLETARTNSAKAMQEANAAIKAKADKQNEAFRKKSEKEIVELEKRLVKAKEEAMDEMNTIAAEVASAAAKKIVGIHPDIEQAKTVVKALNDGSTKAKAA